MDIESIYQDFSIEYVTEGQHKHGRPGWINTPCPWCTGTEGYHLGFNKSGNFFFCWRCGWHPDIDTLSKLLHMTWKESKEIAKKYGHHIKRASKDQETNIRIKAHRLPSEITPLQEAHVRYLTKRKFDPDLLVKLWHLVATGPISSLDHLSYKHRIVIPYIWNGKQVSFDARDITNKQLSKYKACPKDRELIPHKDILYGKQEDWKDTGIIVEGPTDVWRLGTASSAVSGISYTPKQLKLIGKTFKRVAVIFDGQETQALNQANRLVSELKSYFRTDAFRMDIKGDPGDMDQSEADYLVKQIIKT